MNKEKELHEKSLREWKRIILEQDWDALPDLLADNVTYHNPAQFEPLRGRDALVSTLRLVFSIFSDFEYARCFSGDEGFGLEFRGKVNDTAFVGIDLIRFDNAGKMTELVVMIRPVDALMKLGEEVSRRISG